MAVMLETPADLYLRKNFLITASMMEGLNRIIQKCVERAQQALLGFFGREETVTVETISILPLTMLAQRLHNTGQEYIGCHVRIFGELQAELYCYLKDSHARTLVGAVLRNARPRARIMRPLELSALAELTTVLANSYWLVLQGHVPLDWRTTMPVAVSRVERIFALASRIGHYDFLVFHTDLLLGRLGVHLHFCLIPGADCLNRLLESLDAGHLHPLITN